MTDRRVKEYIIGKDAVAEFIKTVQEWKFQKDWEKKGLIFNPETGISEDGTMRDCLYRPWINQPKKEQKMTREEAITVLENIKMDLEHYRDLFMYSHDLNKVIERLTQPITLCDFLGWEEGQEYEFNKTRYKLENGNLMEYFDGTSWQMWFKSNLSFNKIDILKQAKKVEQAKLKAWYVRDEYSLDCLIEELEEQGVTHSIYSTKEEMKRDFKVGWKIIFVDTDNTFNSFHTDKLLDNKYDIFDYHKVEPRYLLQTDLTSENGIQYLSFDKKRRKYFMGALMTSENVQQKFTDSEISKIKSITRFAKLCEKVEVEM